MTGLLSFVAECRTPGMGIEDVSALHAAVAVTSARISAPGARVRYVRSIYIPDGGHWSGLFEAENAQVVRRVVHIVQLRDPVVSRAVEFPMSAGTAPSAVAWSDQAADRDGHGGRMTFSSDF